MTYQDRTPPSRGEAERDAAALRDTEPVQPRNYLRLTTQEAINWVLAHMPGEASLAIIKFTDVNPRWRGAEWADALDALLNADAHLEVTDALFEDMPVEYSPALTSAVAITLLYASRPFATDYDHTLRVQAIIATIDNNGGLAQQTLTDPASHWPNVARDDLSDHWPWAGQPEYGDEPGYPDTEESADLDAIDQLGWQSRGGDVDDEPVDEDVFRGER